jgi:hypothetical protein
MLRHKPWIRGVLLLVVVMSAKAAFGQSLLMPEHYAYLAEHPEWHTILHVKNGESEIDDKGFFFASNGKLDPRAELEASLLALVNDTTDNDDSIYCRFPSRSKWLLEKIPEVAERLQLPACHKNQEELKNLDAQSVTLILASAHINSPASAFGHTFLRIDAQKNTPLTAYAVSYAAMSSEKNGLVFAYKGLMGGYEGRYSIQPYFEMLKEYSDLEHRDVWEYPMNLDAQEIARLVDHILEIRHFYSDYYFFTENCSYNLLWALQVARPGLRLTDQFNFSAIPIDTVRAIDTAGLIDEQIYRASSRKKMVKLAENLQHKESRVFVKSTEYDFQAIDVLDDVEKISALELATFELKNRRSKQLIEHDRYTRDLLQLLKVRSRLGSPLPIDVDVPMPPPDGHLSKRMNAGIQFKRDTIGAGEVVLGFKPAYHDIYDHEHGFLPGAYISFGDTQIIADKRSIKLESFSLIDIRSYAIQDSLFKPVSWQATLGTRRVFEDKQHGFLKVGAGQSVGNDKLYGFVMLMPGLYAYPSAGVSGTAHLGVIGATAHIKFGMQLSHEQFKSARKQQIAEAFMTYQLNQALAFNLKFSRNKMSRTTAINTMTFNVFSYF